MPAPGLPTKNSPTSSKAQKRRLRSARPMPFRDDDAALDIVQDSRDPAGRKVRRPAARRTAAAVPAHPVQRDHGLVPAPEGRTNARVRNFSDFETTGRRRRLQHPGRSKRSTMSRRGAPDSVSRAQILLVIEEWIQQLPGRQQGGIPAALLGGSRCRRDRQVMGCSEGSVKTHCSRAVHSKPPFGQRELHCEELEHLLHPAAALDAWVAHCRALPLA